MLVLLLANAIKLNYKYNGYDLIMILDYYNHYNISIIAIYF